MKAVASQSSGLKGLMNAMSFSVLTLNSSTCQRLVLEFEILHQWKHTMTLVIAPCSPGRRITGYPCGDVCTHPPPRPERLSRHSKTGSSPYPGPWVVGAAGPFIQRYAALSSVFRCTRFVCMSRLPTIWVYCVVTMYRSQGRELDPL